MAVFTHDIDVWDRLCTVGRAPCTKETLPDFYEWCRVTQHPLLFHGLKGCQRTPGFWVSQGRETKLMGSGNAELCSDATCGVKFSTGGGVDDDARSPGVYKVGLVVSWMMAPGADVCVVGDPSNDSKSTRALGEETTILPRPLPLILDPRPTPRPISA